MKEIGSCIYMHKSCIVVEINVRFAYQKALKCIPPEFAYNYAILKYNKKTGDCTFIKSPDWDTSPEPTVGDAILVRPDGSTKFMSQKKNPQIYHHKWMFVPSFYTGFDINESYERSQKYKDTPGLDKSRIGYKKYWESILPELGL